MKVLYLDGRRATYVRLDGPALRVQTAGRADGRYPLGRISRIVTIGEIDWNPQALLACFHFGIPIVLLDARGRFVRLRFAVSADANGLARHLGELIAVGRYRGRFERWRRAAERQARAPVLEEFGIDGQTGDSESLWQAVLRAQASAIHGRPGRYHTLLGGLAMAHLVSIFARLGCPADPGLWTRSEYRLLRSFLALERWHQVAMVRRACETGNGLDCRVLIETFEHEAAAREARFLRWRQELLLALLGIELREAETPEAQVREDNDAVYRMPRWVERTCATVGRIIGGNVGRLPHAPRDSLRSGAKLLRAWLQYDRRCHE